MKPEVKKTAGTKTVNIKQIAKNKRAFFDYEILEALECGIALQGSEVKSAARGGLSLADSFCHVDGGELYLKNAYIAPYEKGSFFNPDARRARKLLIHKSELKRFYGKAQEKGLTIIPLSAYLKGSLLKVEIALAQGKKLHDKRETIKERDIARDTQRQIRESM